jgi:hypothetical protein
VGFVQQGVPGLDAVASGVDAVDAGAPAAVDDDRVVLADGRAGGRGQGGVRADPSGDDDQVRRPVIAAVGGEDAQVAAGGLDRGRCGR